jgi:hypothetical protein
MIYATIVAYQQTVPNTKTKLVNGLPVAESHGTRPFGSSLAYVPFTDTKIYIAITAFTLNVIVAVVLTVILRGIKAETGRDATEPDDYYSEAGDPGFTELEFGLDGLGAAGPNKT